MGAKQAAYHSFVTLTIGTALTIALLHLYNRHLWTRIVGYTNARLGSGDVKASH